MKTLLPSLWDHAQLRSTNIDQFKAELAATHGVDAELERGIRATAVRSSFAQIGSISVGSWRFGSAARVNMWSHGVIALGISVAGAGVVTNGGKRAETSPLRPTLVSANRPVTVDYGADLHKLFVRMPVARLREKLSAILHVPVRVDPEFELGNFVSHEALAGLLELVRVLVVQSGGHGGLLSPLALEQVEEAAMVQLLFAGRHQLTAKLLEQPAEVSEGSVDAAEQFLRANDYRHVPIEELATIAGVSARSLFRSFQTQRGYSPRAFAAKLRLERARRMLANPQADTTVTGVAIACGFANLGRFAHDYWRAFGELPSKTLETNS
jgi:AraC-like DNA-binding protein